MSLTRQPVRSGPEMATPSGAGAGSDPPSLLGAIGNHAAQSLLGLGQGAPGGDSEHEGSGTNPSTPWLAWSMALSRDEDVNAPQLPAVGELPPLDLGTTGAPAAAPAVEQMKQLTLQGYWGNQYHFFDAPTPKANSPLIDNL